VGIPGTAKDPLKDPRKPPKKNPKRNRIREQRPKAGNTIFHVIIFRGAKASGKHKYKWQ